MSASRNPRRPEDLAYAVTLGEAARLLGVSGRTIYRYVEAGALKPFYLPSGRPRLPLSEVLRIRETTERPPASAGERLARARRGRP
ncbi:MAG: helix-turn-helix domain-containing protein [Planctomycetales bacterium]|nr:helix-turn-helix domain-containing protein [Planctomycetales bacterium]